MSIEIHCPKCSRLIKAPDNAGGKFGKCPYCQEKVYVPSPADQIDEIPLAPIDAAEEQKDAELRREAVKYASAVDHAKETPIDTPTAAESLGDGAPPIPEETEEVIDIGENVERFVIAMRDSRLDEADRFVEQLKRVRERAWDYVDGLIVDPTPPEIDDIPKPLLQGFLKTLLERLR